MSGRILPLPESVRSKLRSGVAISSVAQCVEELVLNSLDAGATCIAVRVDLSIFRIQIVDNGNGIRHGDLKVLGSRHATSKCHTLQDLTNNLTHYGFRGEALASIVDLAAIIDITTRSQSSSHTYTKLFTYGKEKSVSASQTPRPSVGTTVTIQDFMYNMPVRRKLIKEAIDIESIRMRLESFALMHPKVSFSLRSDSNNAKIFQVSKSNCLMSTFMQLFGVERAQALAEVYHSVDQFTISGYVSTQPHMTKSLQFVYVNKRVILKTKIHKFMNELLNRSSIISNRLHPTTPVPGKTPSSPAKGLRLYGIFVINIECPMNDYDICLDPRKTLVEFRDWNKLLLCIEEMVIKFIQEENLVISMDERYRKSGREQVVEEDDSPPVPHSSQALLQIFSHKRTGDPKDTIDAPKEKYGRTLCVEDNLSAVQSAPVRRTSKRWESHISYDESNQDGLDDFAPLADDDDEDDFNIRKKANNNNKEPPHPSSHGDIQSSKHSKVEIGQACVTLAERKKEENSDNKDVKQNLWPVEDDVEKFKNLSHAEYIRSIIAKRKESNRQFQEERLHSHCQSDEDLTSATGNSDVEGNDDDNRPDYLSDDDLPCASASLFENENNVSNVSPSDENLLSVKAASFGKVKMVKFTPSGSSKEDDIHGRPISERTRPKMSSLGEFKKLYDAEMKKINIVESCTTLEEDYSDNKAVKQNLCPGEDDVQKYKNVSHVEYIRSIIAKGKESNRQFEEERLRNHCRSDEDLISATGNSDDEGNDEDNRPDYLSDGDLPSASASLFHNEKNVSNVTLSNENLLSVKAASFRKVKMVDFTPSGSSKEDNIHGRPISEGTSPKKSSLENLRKLYDAEMKKMNSLESCTTPEKGLRGTPSTPPPMKSAFYGRPDSPDSIGRSYGSVPPSVESSDIEKKSLCKSLSAGMMKHQKKAKSLQILQKFEFKKGLGNSGCISDNKTTDDQIASGKSDSLSTLDSSNGAVSELQGLRKLSDLHTSSQDLNFGNKETSCSSMGITPGTITSEVKDLCKIQNSSNYESIFNHQNNKAMITKTSEVHVSAKPNLVSIERLDKLAGNDPDIITAMSEVHDSTTMWNDRNVANSHSAKENGLRIISTVAEVHKPKDKRICKNVEKCDGDSSFRFEPVLAAYSGNEKSSATYRYEFSESIIYDETGVVTSPGDSVCEQSICSSDPETIQNKSVHLPEGNKACQLFPDNLYQDKHPNLSGRSYGNVPSSIESNGKGKKSLSKSLSARMNGSKEKKSLSKSLSAVMGKHHMKMKSLQNLQKFEFKKDVIKSQSKSNNSETLTRENYGRVASESSDSQSRLTSNIVRESELEDIRNWFDGDFVSEQSAVNEVRRDQTSEHLAILPDPGMIQSETLHQADQLIHNKLYQDNRSVINRSCYSHLESISDRDYESIVDNTNDESCFVADLPYLSTAAGGSQVKGHPATQFLSEQTRSLQKNTLEYPPTQPFEVGSDIWQSKTQDSSWEFKGTETDVLRTRDVCVQESQGFSPVIGVKLLQSDTSSRNVPLTGTDNCGKISNILGISSPDGQRKVEGQSDCSSYERDIIELSAFDQYIDVDLSHGSGQASSENVMSSYVMTGKLQNSAGHELQCKSVDDCVRGSDLCCLRSSGDLSTESRCSSDNLVEVQNPLHRSHSDSVLNAHPLLMDTNTEADVDATALALGIYPILASKKLSSYVSSVSDHSAASKPNEDTTETPEGQMLPSPSLHFSQLTLPDIAESQLSESTALDTTCDLLGLSTPVISSFSPCSFTRYETAVKKTPAITSSQANNHITDGNENPIHCEQSNASSKMDVDVFPSLTSNDGEEANSGVAGFSGSDSIFIEAEMQLPDNRENGQRIIGDYDKSATNENKCESFEDGKNTNSATESKEPKIVDGWKESFDKDGKTIYINLRTGNTMYDVPIARVIPEWTSSQPLGAPLLKVPLSHEPGYIPFGKDHPRQDFTLSHGFSAFMSWKKRRDAEKICCIKEIACSSAELVPSSKEKESAYPITDENSSSLPEGGEDRYDDPVLAPIPQETIDALLKDFEDDNVSVKWSNKPSFDKDENQPNVAKICQMWEAPSFAMDADVLQSEPQVMTGVGASAVSKGGPVRVYNIVHPFKFSREMLLSCKVLGQIDNKFIACKMKHTLQDEPDSAPTLLLVLFDQHAVHERVRLETIIEENYEVAHSGKRVIRSSMVTPPLSMTLPDDEVRLMLAYSELFIQRGLHFSKISTSKVAFHAIPNCLVAREASGLQNRRCQTASVIVESIVRDMCHTLHTTGGVVGNIPKPLIYVLNSQACRGAIKFGDELTLSECQELIMSLSSCQLPFQCAHGRPSVVPMANLTHLAKLDKNDRKPNIKRLVAAMQNQV